MNKRISNEFEKYIQHEKSIYKAFENINSNSTVYLIDLLDRNVFKSIKNNINIITSLKDFETLLIDTEEKVFRRLEKMLRLSDIKNEKPIYIFYILKDFDEIEQSVNNDELNIKFYRLDRGGE